MLLILASVFATLPADAFYVAPPEAMLGNDDGPPAPCDPIDFSSICPKITSQPPGVSAGCYADYKAKWAGDEIEYNDRLAWCKANTGNANEECACYLSAQLWAESECDAMDARLYANCP